MGLSLKGIDKAGRVILGRLVTRPNDKYKYTSISKKKINANKNFFGGVGGALL